MNIFAKRIALLLTFLLSASIFWYFNLTQFLNLDWIQTHHHYLVRMVNEHYWYSVLMYISLYILVTAFAVPGAFLMTMLGGYLFGVFPGVLYIDIGATLGASLAFLAARYVVGVWVQRKYQQQLRAVNQEIKERGNYYFLIARLIVVLPFFLVNLVAGLTRVSFTTFMWTTAVGIMPAVIVYAYAGRQLMHINGLQDIFMWPVIVAFVLLGLLLLLPLLLTGRKKW